MLAAIGILAAIPAARADILFYQQDGFRGRSFVSDQTIPNFADLGFNDRASSVIIRSGSWQLCTDAYFRGRCVTLQPGEYPSLRSMQLENQISSARELDWHRPGPGGPPPGGPRPAGQVELYEGNGFSGRAFPISGPTSSFPAQFNDRASSMVVHEGYWEACENIGYRGACQVYGPGRYASLGGMSNRISSIRPVAAPGYGPEAGGWGSGARALLYEGPDLSGRSFIIDDEVVANLANTGFNDRASSLAHRGRLLDVLQRRQFHRRVPTPSGRATTPRCPGPSTTGSRRAGGSATSTRTPRARTGSRDSRRWPSSTTSRGSRGS